MNGQEGINVSLYHKQVKPLYDFCQFRSAGLRHEDAGRVAAGRHEVNALYLRILTDACRGTSHIRL